VSVLFFESAGRVWKLNTSGAVITDFKYIRRLPNLVSTSRCVEDDDK
jgi:hypothetical protein